MILLVHSKLRHGHSNQFLANAFCITKSNVCAIMWTILLYEYDYQNSSIKAWSRPDLDEDTKNVLYSELYDNMSPFYKVSEVIFFLIPSVWLFLTSLHLSIQRFWLMVSQIHLVVMQTNLWFFFFTKQAFALDFLRVNASFIRVILGRLLAPLPFTGKDRLPVIMVGGFFPRSLYLKITFVIDKLKLLNF